MPMTKRTEKCATLLAYEGVCAISNKTIADSFQIQASMRPKVKKSGETRITCIFLRTTLVVSLITKKEMC